MKRWHCCEDVEHSNKKFTWKELGKLNSKNNVHIAYNQKVYDVSSFVSHHPGGAEQIMVGAGHDITEVFKVYHKRDTFDKVLSKYHVGELIDSEVPVFINTSNFYDTIRDRVEQHVALHKLDPKKDRGEMFAVYCTTLLLYFTCWFLMMYFCETRLLSVTYSVVWGLSTSMIGNTLMHDASHFSISHKPWVWKLGSVISSIIVGISMYTWRYQHVLGHHSYTNIEGADPDITMSKSKDSVGVWRISPSQPWTKIYMYQHLYMPLLYPVVAIKVLFQDFFDIFSLTKNTIRMNPLTTLQWAEFWLTKILNVSIRFAIPFMFMPLSDFIIAILIYETTYSVCLGQLSQLNHNTSDVDWVMSNTKENNEYNNWAELQVTTTQDYCTDSWFWTLFTGSLNHQVAHHLFPGYIQSHYRWITPIIKTTCAEFGVHYNCVDSFVECVGLHYKHLRNMGCPVTQNN